MAKKSVKKKGVVSRKTIVKSRRKKPFLKQHIITLLLVVGALFLVLHNQLFSIKKQKALASQLETEPSISKIQVSEIPTPTPTALPTPSPTLAQAPNPNDFCLNVPVLFYHHIQPQSDATTKGQTSLSVDNGMFDSQMAYVVAAGYHSISAETLIQALRAHTQLGKAIVITFDDGYKDNALYADPVLQKYGLMGNLMLATGLVGGQDYLDWGQVDQLKSHGWYFTDHTWSHYPVNSGSNDKIQYEITTARQQLQDHTGQSIDVFTYPYGSFNNNAINLLQQDGFAGAYSTIGGTYQCESFIMTLHRTRVGNARLSAYGI